MKNKEKILIVEDEMIIAYDIQMTLESLGYDVTGIACNADEALQLINENRPDLVLLDINLEGDTDGIMLAEDINYSFQIPFIYLSSNTDNLTVNRIKRTKAAGFIVKPFSEDDLKTNIEIALFNNENKEKNLWPKDLFVKEGNAWVKIKLDDLRLVQAEDNYAKLIIGKQSYLVLSSLKKIALKLPSNIFIRIHRSYIININYIDQIQEGYVIIGKYRLPIGRSYQAPFFNQISKL